MAACLITVSGTSGEVEVKYNIGITPYSVIAGVGTFYIEDTATDVTYTTLYGDASADSICLIVTNTPFICYKFFWKGVQSPGYKFDAVLLGAEIIPITEVAFPYTNVNLAAAINNLNDNRIKVVQYKVTVAFDSSEPSAGTYEYIVKSTEAEPPQLRIQNADDTGYIYLHAESSTCTMTGGIDVDLCYPEELPL